MLIAVSVNQFGQHEVCCHFSWDVCNMHLPNTMCVYLKRNEKPCKISRDTVGTLRKNSGNWSDILHINWLPLWSSSQEFLATDPEVPGSIPGATRFSEVVGLEGGPLSLMTTTELIERKIRGSGLESWENGHRVPSRWSRGTLYPQKLALTSRGSLVRYSSLMDSGHGV
jgi:hypothetical protein